MVNPKSLANLRPNIFSSENQPKKHGRQHGRSPTEWLRYFAKHYVKGTNPLSGKVENLETNAIVALQLILKATQDSDLPSIKEYFDRIDGKVVEKVQQELQVTAMPKVKLDGKDLEVKFSDK
jgi:hypothetical protein